MYILRTLLELSGYFQNHDIGYLRRDARFKRIIALIIAPLLNKDRYLGTAVLRMTQMPFHSNIFKRSSFPGPDKERPGVIMQLLSMAYYAYASYTCDGSISLVG